MCRNGTLYLRSEICYRHHSQQRWLPANGLNFLAIWWLLLFLTVFHHAFAEMATYQLAVEFLALPLSSTMAISCIGEEYFGDRGSFRFGHISFYGLFDWMNLKLKVGIVLGSIYLLFTKFDHLLASYFAWPCDLEIELLTLKSIFICSWVFASHLYRTVWIFMISTCPE